MVVRGRAHVAQQPAHGPPLYFYNSIYLLFCNYLYILFVSLFFYSCSVELELSSLVLCCAVMSLVMEVVACWLACVVLALNLVFFLVEKVRNKKVDLKPENNIIVITGCDSGALLTYSCSLSLLSLSHTPTHTHSHTLIYTHLFHSFIHRTNQ